MFVKNTALKEAKGKKGESKKPFSRGSKFHVLECDSIHVQLNEAIDFSGFLRKQEFSRSAAFFENGEIKTKIEAREKSLRKR